MAGAGGSGWPRGSGRFDDDGGGQGDSLANPSRRPPRRLSVSTKNEVERSGVGLGWGLEILMRKIDWSVLGTFNVAVLI